jgi:ABC-type glucose/galactose transport system permease subunit
MRSVPKELKSDFIIHLLIGIIRNSRLTDYIRAVKIPMANGVLTLSPDWQYIITGIIVALAVYADARSSARKR